jgi:aldose 1-epimerase
MNRPRPAYNATQPAMPMKSALMALLLGVSACTPFEPPGMTWTDLPLIDASAFEGTVNGDSVDLYTLRAEGIVAQITNYGGRVVNLFVADRAGTPGDVVLGLGSLPAYQEANERFLGALIGRYGNRIGAGRFLLDGTEYVLATNNGPNHLHGGVIGFDRVVWTANQPDSRTLELRYTSPDMEEGYPGRLKVLVRYRVTDDHELRITYRAETDAPTVVNLTHHSFFNLAGPGSGPIADHRLEIRADQYTPVDNGLIPTGELASVDGTPMDFRVPTAIGLRVGSDFDQLGFGGGYDHNWVLRPNDGTVRVVARVSEPTTGRVMEVLTDEPGLQFYGGNFFDGSDVGTSGEAHRYREAFALETQHFPDSPNQDGFPSTVLRPGDTYRSTCVYRFSTAD